MIVVRKDESNSQIHHLHIDSNSLIVLAHQDLDDFQDLFFKLLRKVREMGEAIMDMDKTRYAIMIYQLEGDLLADLLAVYRQLSNVYTGYALFKWPAITKDREILSRLYTIVFTKLQEIQIKLFESVAAFKYKENLEYLQSVFWNSTKLDNKFFSDSVKRFRYIGLEKELNLL